MHELEVNKAAFLSGLPELWPHSLMAEIRECIRDQAGKVMVLDDDPTGTQTVHGVPVLTHWAESALVEEFEDPFPLCYILTNSRSLPSAQAESINREIGRNLTRAARRTGRRFSAVSRSDSTLRGHFPGEVIALAEALETDFDAWLLIPFFLEGGRFTAGDIHYVEEGDAWVPAAQTEFARDDVFGYRTSNLRKWVEEKTAGRVRAQEVASITLEDLRRGGPDRVAQCLRELKDQAVCIVNSVSLRDQEVFVRGLLEAEKSGKRFLFRTAASFVQVRAGLQTRPLLQAQDFDLGSGSGALLVVGSYVPRTQTQLRSLLAEGTVSGVELAVPRLLDERVRQGEIAQAIASVNRSLERGGDVVVYTSRDRVSDPDPEAALRIGQRVSEALVEVVREITVRPRYILAKGGITSSDVATAALGIRRAIVQGQILPGVPVWRCGPETRWPGLGYIVFPGNVGGGKALVRITGVLGAKRCAGA